MYSCPRGPHFVLRSRRLFESARTASTWTTPVSQYIPSAEGEPTQGQLPTGTPPLFRPRGLSESARTDSREDHAGRLTANARSAGSMRLTPGRSGDVHAGFFEPGSRRRVLVINSRLVRGCQRRPLRAWPFPLPGLYWDHLFSDTLHAEAVWRRGRNSICWENFRSVGISGTPN